MDGVTVVIDNSCNQSVTYEVRGKRVSALALSTVQQWVVRRSHNINYYHYLVDQALFLGREDLHDRRYDSTELVVPFDVGALVQDDAKPGECIHTFHIYSSSTFEEAYRSSLPEVLTTVVAGAFFFLILSFFIYDWFVKKRNRKVTTLAARSSEIVSSLFPTPVRDRFIAERGTESTQNAMFHGTVDQRLQSFLAQAEGGVEAQNNEFMYKSKPIADLYPETTVLFADIAGFTAWSSTRDPTHVFTLLETLYGAFDEIARRRNVFKIEVSFARDICL